MLSTIRNLARDSKLYSITIFLSAFLLFQIQPMIARYLLPSFGGSVAVWGTALVFFTSVLFLGYLYVYLISELTPKRQAQIHLAFIAATIILVISVIIAGYTFAPHLWVFDWTSSPSTQILLALAVTIGLPYLLLSTTGPLLQHWYSKETGKEPYHLYALSNIGSFLALGTYPFVIETTFGLQAQQALWTLFFIGCAILLAILAFKARKLHGAEVHAHDRTIDPWVLASWLGLAALPSALLVATTARITQVIAPVPFLWVAPLALYLLSFILAFRGWGQTGLTPFLILLSGAASFLYIDWSYADFSRQAVSNLALMFFGSLYCHALLYKMRPKGEQSSFYYVWISLGGAIGSLVVALIAPVIFLHFTEFPIALTATAVLAILLYPAMTYLKEEYRQHAAFLKGIALAGILLAFGTYVQDQTTNNIYESRNFYGGVEVYGTDDMRYLYHGTTLHGTQWIKEDQAHDPTTYYIPTSGVGRALIRAQSLHSEEPIKVGTIGLGTGTVAAYCFAEDNFIFYEIDPRMEDVAREYFTYLERCRNSEVHIGDGRLVLERELAAGQREDFDVLAIDAFSDDTVPVHLLTKESVELYMARLKPEGVLAIHTSNRYLELSPVVLRVAVELGLSAILVQDYAEGNDAGTTSQWVLLARTADIFADEVFKDAADPPLDIVAPLWTDDYANVWATVDKTSFTLWQTNNE